MTAYKQIMPRLTTALTGSGVATGGGTGGYASPHLSQGPIVGFVQIR